MSEDRRISAYRFGQLKFDLLYREDEPRQNHHRKQVRDTSDSQNGKSRAEPVLCSGSGSAFPATLAIKVRELAPQGFKLDSVATVIDCVNFEGYEDSSPTAKVRATKK